MLSSIVGFVQLWEAALSYAPSLVPQLVAYFPSLVDIMERSFDHLQVGLRRSDYIISFLVYCCYILHQCTTDW